MMDKTTHLYDLGELNEELISSILSEVSYSLKEKGYNLINQLTGYLMSGDPGYISSYQNARTKVTSIERSKIIEVLLRKGMS